MHIYVHIVCWLLMLLSGKFPFAAEFSHRVFPLQTAINLAKMYIYSPEECIWQLAFIFYNFLSLRL